MTAPSRRDGQESGNSGGVLAALSRMADGSFNSPEELRIMKWVVLRETYLTKLQGIVSAGRKRAIAASRDRRGLDALNNAKGRPKLFGLLTELLTVLRRITVEIVEAIQRWRRGDSKKPFIWGSSNYLLKASKDVAFLARLPGLEQHLGVAISHNPFLCHVRLDGRPAILPLDKTTDGTQGRAVGPGSGGNLLNTKESLGVTVERVEAAAAVLYREVLRARGGRHLSHSNESAQVRQSDGRTTTESGPIVPPHAESGSLHAPMLESSVQLNTGGETYTLPPDDESLEYQDAVGYREDQVLEETQHANHCDEPWRASQDSTRRLTEPGSISHTDAEGGPYDCEETWLATPFDPANEAAAHAADDVVTPEWESNQYPSAAVEQPTAASQNFEVQDETSDRSAHKESPFMAVFDMCNGIVTNLQGLGLANKNVEGTYESPTLGTVCVQQESPPAIICRWEEEGDDAPTTTQPQSNVDIKVGEEEPLLRGAAYDSQTRNFSAERTADSNMRRRTPRSNGDQEEEEESFGVFGKLTQKTSKETMATYFLAWAGRAEARLRYREAKAARHHRCKLLQRAMSVWEAYRAGILGGRLAEAFAGRFGLASRFFVRFAFDALRAHAKGSRVATRNRLAMGAFCARLETAGRSKLLQAWQRWWRATGHWGPEYEKALVRLCKLWLRGRLRAAFDTWRPPVALQQKRSAAALRGKLKLAGSIAALVGTATSKTATTVGAAKDLQRSKAVITQAEEDNWEQWLGDDGSLSCASRGDGGEGAPAITRDRGLRGTATVNSGGGDTDAGVSQMSPGRTLRGLGARIKSMKSFRDMRDKSQVSWNPAKPHAR